MEQTPVERIELRKIYVGRAAIFGLLYGLVTGLIIGIFFFVGSLIGLQNGFTFFGKALNISGVGMGSIALIVSIIFFSVASFISMAVSAFIYNLISQIGGTLHIGLAERGQEMSG
ncbi:MAG: hypothetical protein AABX83_03070 [Nanoarchaeota archaeon]